MKKWVIICGMALSYFNVFYCYGQTLETDQIKPLTSQKFNVAITNLHHFLRLQNNGNFPEQIQTNLHWCDSVFTALNFEIDRYIIDSTRGNSNEQYILFANYSFNV